MSVYVDQPLLYPFEVPGYVGRPRQEARWCHMIADTLPELHAMAEQIGLRREWLQVSRTGVPHYDLIPTKRALAIKNGALAVERAQFVEKVQAIKAAAKVPA